MSTLIDQPSPPLDEQRLNAFVERLVGDLAGTTTVLLAHLGDRLGLFAELHRGGPATSSELAARAAIDERYAREWLHGLASAGYLEREAGGRFALPPEHAQALAVEAGPFFVGGALQMLPAMVAPLDRLVEAFRDGGGVPQDALPRASSPAPARTRGRRASPTASASSCSTPLPGCRSATTSSPSSTSSTMPSTPEACSVRCAGRSPATGSCSSSRSTAPTTRTRTSARSRRCSTASASSTA